QTGRQLASVIADRVRIQVTKDGQTKGGMVPAKHLSIMLGSEAFLRHFRPLDEVARTSQYLADFIPTTPGYNDRGPAQRVLDIGQEAEVRNSLETTDAFLDPMDFETPAHRTNA